MNTPAPLPDFLLAGGPDPQTPRPRAYETLRGSGSHTPGSSETESNAPLDMGFLGIPTVSGRNDVENMGAGKFDLPGDFVPPPPPKIPAAQRPDNMGNLNVPIAHTPVSPNALAIPTAPAIDEDPDYEVQSPEIQRFLRSLVKTGRIGASAERAGIGKSALYKTRDKNKKFRELWAKALESRGELLEDEAMRRAVQGIEEPVFYMGAVCGYKRVYSDSLLGKLLDGNLPEKYRANHKVEVSGSLGVATLVLPAVTTAEQWLEQNNGTIIEQLPESDYD